MSGALDAAKGALSASRRVINNPGIAQDNVIFAMLLFAFVVWITTKGELGTYLAFFKPGTGTGPITDPIVASSTTGATQAPGGGGTVVPSGIPGVPGLNLSNPLAGIPLLGGLGEMFTGNSSAGTVQQGASNLWGSFKGLF